MDRPEPITRVGSWQNRKRKCKFPVDTAEVNWDKAFTSYIAQSFHPISSLIPSAFSGGNYNFPSILNNSIKKKKHILAIQQPKISQNTSVLHSRG